MYGKVFETMYTGSMVGKGALTFAVWGYVIAMMRPDRVVGAQVELNPKLLDTILGEPEAEIIEVINRLCEPDPESRTKTEGGRRLVRLGQFSYRVVNGQHYRQIRTEEERREYMRNWMRDKRSKLKKIKNVPSLAEQQACAEGGQ